MFHSCVLNYQRVNEYMELSEVMGVPPVIIHYNIGLSIANHPFFGILHESQCTTCPSPGSTGHISPRAWRPRNEARNPPAKHHPFLGLKTCWAPGIGGLPWTIFFNRKWRFIRWSQTKTTVRMNFIGDIQDRTYGR